MSGRTARAYAMVAASFLLAGVSGTLVSWTTAPESVLLVLRFAIATLAIGAVFGRRRRLAGLLDRRLWPRLLLMGAFDATTLLLYFVAIREAGVAVATFCLFVQPVWVTLLAPRLLGSKTEGFVYVGVGLALTGLVILLIPAVLGDGVHVSALGLAAGFASGWTMAGFALMAKDIARRVESIAMVLVQCALDGLFLVPLALWQMLASGYTLTSRDLMVSLIMGLLVTAVGYTLWMEGMRWVRVQHSAMLGFLVPVAAPVFAWVLLGQTIAGWTVVGGAFILAAGALVVLRGDESVEGEPPV